MVQGRIDAGGREGLGRINNSKLHILTYDSSRHGSPFVPLFPLDRSIESGDKADLEGALQMLVRNVANAHNVVVMSSQSVTKSNLQIGSLQIDVHEPVARLSQAVISIQVRDRRPNIVRKSV